MNCKWIRSAILVTIILFLVSCASEQAPQQDLINDSFPGAQAEIREAVKAIVNDAEMANIAGLQAAHLISDKFTKFGPRSFERQDIAGTNESEAAFFGSISEYKQEARDLKIDVFGDVGIATYYPHASFVQDGVGKTASGRQTLVFLKTENGWKIIHEHGTPNF